MKSPRFWLVAALVLLYCGYLVWYFQIRPNLGTKRIVWRTDFMAGFGDVVQVATGGEIYLLDYSGLRVLASDGHELWSTKPESQGIATIATSMPSSFALRPDGGVYVVEQDFNMTQGAVSGSNMQVRSLDRLGNEEWKSPLSSQQGFVSSSRCIGFSGGVIVFSETGTIDVFNLQGKPTGSFRPANLASKPIAGSVPMHHLAVAPDGKCFVAGGGVSAYDSTGKLLWSWADPLQPTESLLLCRDDGTVCYANGTELVVLDGSGTEMWTSPLALTVFQPGTICLDPAGRIACLDSASRLKVYDLKGAVVVNSDMQASMNSFLSCGPEGQIYLCDPLKGISAYGPDCTPLWKSLTPREPQQAAYIGPDGRLYARDNAVLYCLRP